MIILKVCFMGTPEFALPALDRLIRSRHKVALVLTQPDRPRGRGRRVIPSPVKQLADEHELTVFQPERLKKEGPQVAAAIRDSGARISVVASYGQILPDEILNATPFGCINIHPSLLPAYRGAAPVQRCILDGNTQTGVTIMKVVREVDAGPVIAQQTLEILPDDDARSFSEMAAVIGAEMLIQVIGEAEKTGLFELEEQDHDAMTYADRIHKEEGLINWNRTTEEIMFHLRGMTPWPGSYTFINGWKQLTIIQAEPFWEEGTRNLGEEEDMLDAEPGTVTGIMKGFGFSIRTGSGHLLATRVKLEGKKQVDAASFILGRGVQQGDRLCRQGEIESHE
jgi:methionyl-tRNA formyltransferase